MNIVAFTADYILPFVITLTILIFFHELGHYWIARLNKVRVEVFSVGFGPEIYGFTDKAGTRWKFSAIPFGGYVKMFGETDFIDEPTDDEEPRPLTPEEEAVSFTHKSIGQRASIVAAGPIANFVLAIVMFAFIAVAFGVPRDYYAGVGQISPGSPAESADIRTGDRILSVDGKSVTWFSELVEAVSAKPGVEVTLVIKRGHEELTVRATPMRIIKRGEDGNDIVIGRLGIRPDPAQADLVRMGPLDAVWVGVEQTIGLTENILDMLGDLVTGRGDRNDVGGPLRIAEFSGKTFQSGIDNFIWFMAVLSVNLGLINLFPIPILDGGHLLFIGAEALRGRPLGARAQEYGFRFGLILVLILMVFATWNDLVHLQVIEYIKELVT